MSNKIVIIDYKLGNLFSVQQACTYLGYDAVISSSPADLNNAAYAILPGVGAFADAMHNLEELGLSEAIKQYVKKGKPLMGVCLGQQLMLSQSEEFENANGLGLIEGTVKKIPLQNVNNEMHKVPQIQWNTIQEPIEGHWQGTALQECKNGDYVYFVHSFYTEVKNQDYILAKTKYGNLIYCSAIQKENIFTTQFHPEKSGVYGLNIYKNWLLLNK
jgi:glutamine amidotransferase